ncbi:MAG: tetratricopeptide repeat protein, partial [Gemmatimonadota bacterium]
MKSYQEFFAELMRRSVFKVAAVYGATAFVLLQIADLLKDGLRLPDTFIPFITAVVLLGFPLALILAWAFQVTPEGVRRTGVAAPGELDEIVRAPASKRWPAGLLALAGFAALVAGVWFAGQRSGVSAALDAAGTGLDGSGAIDADRGVLFAYVDLADDPRPSIAVLPFADMSPEGDQEYFSDGMTEEILNVLAKLQDLRVTARTSAFAFKDRQMDMRAVGDSLGVRYLVEGSVRKAGDQLRITAQLIDAADGSHLWSESYDRTLENVFQIQSEIAEAIAEELRLPLGLSDPSQLITPTVDIEAYDLYLAGRARMRERGKSLPEAIRLFEAALVRDSTWATAWASLSEAKELLSYYPKVWEEGDPGDGKWAGRRDMFFQYQEAAEVAAKKALSLNPDLASAHVALGSILRNRHEWSRAESEFLRALTLDPDNAEAHQQYSEMLGNMGRIQEARRAAERAAALDRVPVRLLQVANALGADGRVDEALDVVREALMLDSEQQILALVFSWLYFNMEAGRYDSMFDLVPDSLSIFTPEEREQMVQALTAGDASLYPPDKHDVTSWLIFDQPDRAAISLLADIREKSFLNTTWIWDNFFDPLRDQPAYLEALRVLNIESATPQRTLEP